MSSVSMEPKSMLSAGQIDKMFIKASGQHDPIRSNK